MRRTFSLSLSPSHGATILGRAPIPEIIDHLKAGTGVSVLCLANVALVCGAVVQVAYVADALVRSAVWMWKAAAAMFADDMCHELFAMNGLMELSPG